MVEIRRISEKEHRARLRDTSVDELISETFEHDTYVDQAGIPRFKNSNYIAFPFILNMWHRMGKKFNLVEAIRLFEVEAAQRGI